MGGREYPLSLVIKAVDRATGPLDRVTARLERMNAPFARLGKSADRFGRRLSAFSEESGLTKLGGGFKGVGSAMGKVGSEVFSLGAKFVALGALAGVTFFHFIKGGVDAGDVLAKTSDRLGVSIDYFAQLSFVAGRAGISQEELTTSFDQFNKRLGQARMKTGSLYEALKHTPAAFQKQVKGAKTNEEALDLMFVALSRIKDPAKRAAFAAEVFGKSGMKMGALVQNGVGEIAELRAEYVRMNGSQEAFARGAEVLNDAMGDVETAFSGVKVSIMAELFPAMTDLAGVVKEFLVTNRKGIALWAKDTAAAITGWVKDGGIDRLVTSFRKFSDTVSPIVEKLGGWPLVLGGISAAIIGGPLLGALATLGGAFLSLGAAILTTPVGWFLLAAAGIAGAAFLVVKNWEPVKGFFAEWFPNLTKGIQDVWVGLKTLVEWFGRAAAAEKSWEMRKQLEQDALASRPDSELSLWERGLKWAGRNDTAGRAQRASLNAAGALPQGAPLNAGDARPLGGSLAAAPPSKAQVTIDVRGPRGTRITEAPDNDADVDTSLGITNQ